MPECERCKSHKFTIDGRCAMCGESQSEETTAIYDPEITEYTTEDLRELDIIKEYEIR